MYLESFSMYFLYDANFVKLCASRGNFSLLIVLRGKKKMGKKLMFLGVLLHIGILTLLLSRSTAGRTIVSQWVTFKPK